METVLRLNGRIPSKKNSRVNTRSGRSFPSKKYMEWHTTAMWEVKSQKPPMEIDRCEIQLIFHMPDRRRADLTNKAESIMDLLVDAGVLTDDSWQVVTPITLHGFYDKENPGVEIIINTCSKE
jgi:Holliday junction resolvase RusA-like endonuclease